MWIFCCGSYRSGSTLQYNMVSELVESAGLGKRIEFYPPEEFTKAKEKYKDFDGIKVFKTHKLTGEIANEFTNNNAQAVYSIRDIRDVIISIAAKNDVEVDEYINNEGFINSYIEDYFKWKQVPFMYRNKYENFVHDIESELIKIASFLDIRLSEISVEEIAKKLSIDSQKKYLESKAVYTDDNNQVVFDSKTLLHNNHFNSGAVAQWKEKLSLSQIEKIENNALNWLYNNGYEITNKHLLKSKQLYSYSQHGEDDFIWQYFDEKSEGMVVEVGAFDGIHLSNSYALENIGWKTICMEASSKFFRYLYYNRPTSIKYNVAAVGDEDLKKVSFNQEDIGLLSGVEMDSEDVQRRYENRGLNFSSQVTEIEARTLNSILKELNVKPNEINCISIDVEGTEIDVLKGFDLSYYCPKMLIIEANTEKAEQKLIEYLKNFGYKKIKTLGPNLILIPSSHPYNDNYNFKSIPIRQIHPLGDKFTIQSTTISMKKDVPESLLRRLKNRIKKLF